MLLTWLGMNAELRVSLLQRLEAEPTHFADSFDGTFSSMGAGRICLCWRDILKFACAAPSDGSVVTVQHTSFSVLGDVLYCFGVTFLLWLPVLSTLPVVPTEPVFLSFSSLLTCLL